MFVAATAVALAAMVATQDQVSEPPPAGPDATALPISVDRIRDALQHPPLIMPLPPDALPTFRTTIEDKSPAFESALEGMRRDLALWSGAGSVIHAPNANSIPARGVAGVNVLPLLSSLRKAWSDAKAGRVRRGITEELAAFCRVNDCTVLEGGISTAPEGIVVPPTPD
jgi:hypothetical protein